MRPGATRFATNYIALDSLLKKRADLKKVFISNDWSSHKLSRTVVGHEVERLMFDHQYWEKVEKLVSIYETLYTVLRIVDSGRPNHAICLRVDSVDERKFRTTQS